MQSGVVVGGGGDGGMYTFVYVGSHGNSGNYGGSGFNVVTPLTGGGGSIYTIYKHLFHSKGLPL